MDPNTRNRIAASIEGFRLPAYQEIPDVGLYLEQTAKYISDCLAPVQDLPVTGSMISNYVKKGLIAKPVRKQYNREQIAQLMFIAVAKMVLSMDDVHLMLTIQRQTYPSQIAYDYFHTENYTNILQAVHDDIDSYIGMKIKFTGYVYRLIDFEENQFVLARDMFINEEKNQTVVVGFLSENKNANEFQDGEWVEVTGIIEKGKYHNKEIPIINVTDIRKTDMPENTFVNVPSDTYVPTSGLL